MRLTTAAIQMAMGDDLDANVATAERLVRDAAAQGAQLILLPELFEGPYFCKDMKPELVEVDRQGAGAVRGAGGAGPLLAAREGHLVVRPGQRRRRRRHGRGGHHRDHPRREGRAAAPSGDGSRQSRGHGGSSRSGGDGAHPPGVTQTS